MTTRSLMDRIGEVQRPDILGHWDADMGELRTRIRGFRVILLRQPDFGVWLGYLGIPLWRPLLVLRSLRNSHFTDFRVYGRGGKYPFGYLWFGLDFAHFGQAAPVPTSDGGLLEGEYGDAAMMLVALEELLDQLSTR